MGVRDDCELPDEFSVWGCTGTVADDYTYTGGASVVDLVFTPDEESLLIASVASRFW